MMPSDSIIRSIRTAGGSYGRRAGGIGPLPACAEPEIQALAAQPVERRGLASDTTDA